MLHAITVTNFRGESLLMELEYPERTGLMVYEVTGIGSGQATINMNDMATTDGASYVSSRLTTRNIVINIKLMETDTLTVEDSRHRSYRYFPTKKPLSLKFHTDSGIRCIDGYVEHNDPVIFSKQEYTQISIVCPDPYFYDETYTNMVLSGYHPLFEFPFCNDSLDENLLIMDDLTLVKRISFVYRGESDTGMIIVLQAHSEVKNITLYNNETSEIMFIDTNKFPSELGSHMVTADRIEISTYIGRRSAYLIRDGIRYNIINSLGRHTPWFSLIAGVNTFSYSAEEGENKLDVSMEYKNVYEGV